VAGKIKIILRVKLMSNFNVKDYLENITRYYKDEKSSEMSYRTDFQRLLEIYFPIKDSYHIQHDPKASSGNKPDYIIIRNGVPLLYIEVKKIGENLDKIEKSEQANRYFGYTNLIISDYLNFRFYRNGEKYNEPISLGIVEEKESNIRYLLNNEEYLKKTFIDFVSSKKEPIKSGKHLAKIMGGKAQRIRDNIIAYLSIEKKENVELIKIMTAIKENLISDVDVKTFADIYAQTLVYGLFVARYNDKTPKDFSRQEARELVPSSNPFLKNFFDHIAGTNFPKRLDILVMELCEVFTHANVHDLMEEYYDQEKSIGEIEYDADPVIHFYEDFLLEYDSKKKMEMGVFYTPRYVVKFIIRSIDEILKREFKISKGLSDNQKISYRPNHESVKKKEIHRVQILDIATGTGTFLNETIQYIYNSFKGHEGKWPLYINEDLIPRLFGFELMMASYTIAHLKLSMTLEHTGVQNMEERLNIFLTNTLDEIRDYSLQGTLFGFLDSIADESKSASRIKNEFPIMAVIGNPPYSGFSQNKHYNGNNSYKVEPGGKQKLQERKHWLDDDYVKFIRFAESMIEKNGEGVVGMITAHGYIDNPTFRGMRWHLRTTFDELYVLDLHGNSNKKETTPSGQKDENVFNIKTGVSIILGIKKKIKDKNYLAKIYSYDVYGLRSTKKEFLDKNDIYTIDWDCLPEDCDIWKIEGEGKNDYNKGFSISNIFKMSGVGIVTARDSLTTDFNKDKLYERVIDFDELSENEARIKYSLGNDAQSWKIRTAKNDLKKIGIDDDNIHIISYRPFDNRYVYYTPNSSGFLARPNNKIMQHFINKANYGLVFARTQKNPEWNAIFITKYITEAKLGEASTQSSVAPLYLYDEDGNQISNLDAKIVESIDEISGKTNPEDILDYIYAVLHSNAYRIKNREFLKQDFPVIPYPKNKSYFWKMVGKGSKLRNIHLLNDPIVKCPITIFPESGTQCVEKIKFQDDKVFINNIQYFGCVKKDVWNFSIGGYQPAQKYLKDRKRKTLSNNEIERYEEIIVALTETIKLMKEIDEIIEL